MYVRRALATLTVPTMPTAVAADGAPAAARVTSSPPARVAAAHPSDLLARLEAANDPRRDRYLRLLAVINGWPSPAGTAPAIDWFVRAVRARSG